VKEVDIFLEGCIANRRKQEQELQGEGSEGTKGRKDMFHYLRQVRDPDTGAPLYSKEEVESENGLLLIAVLLPQDSGSLFPRRAPPDRGSATRTPQLA
jgi:hypothetical protein